MSIFYPTERDQDETAVSAVDNQDGTIVMLSSLFLNFKLTFLINSIGRIKRIWVTEKHRVIDDK